MSRHKSCSISGRNISIQANTKKVPNHLNKKSRQLNCFLQNGQKEQLGFKVIL